MLYFVVHPVMWILSVFFTATLSATVNKMPTTTQTYSTSTTDDVTVFRLAWRSRRDNTMADGYVRNEAMLKSRQCSEDETNMGSSNGVFCKNSLLSPDRQHSIDRGSSAIHKVSLTNLLQHNFVDNELVNYYSAWAICKEGFCIVYEANLSTTRRYHKFVNWLIRINRLWNNAQIMVD